MSRDASGPAPTAAAAATEIAIHGSPERRKAQQRLRIALGLALSVLALEIAGGLLTNSLALLADAGHVLGDAGAVGLALGAMWLAGRDGGAQRTFGWHRAEILVALANGLGLFVIAGLIIWQAAERIGDEREIRGAGLFAIATVGLIANLAAAYALRSTQAHSLNLRGAYLHVVGDALGSVAAIIAGVVILASGWTTIDVIASLTIAALIMIGGGRLVRETLEVLLETAPRGADVNAIATAITEVPGVVAVHDLHYWTVTSGFRALSCHVEVAAEADGQRVLVPVARLLRERFGVRHMTLQPETAALHDVIECCDFPDLPASGSMGVAAGVSAVLSRAGRHRPDSESPTAQGIRR